MHFVSILAHVAQWIRHRPPKPRIVGSSPTVGKLFPILIILCPCVLSIYTIRDLIKITNFRRNVWDNDLLKERVDNYTSEGHVIKQWDIGTLNHYAGYHCSWCYKPGANTFKMIT